MYEAYVEDGIPEVTKEALEVIRVKKFGFSVACFFSESIPLIVDFSLMVIDALCLVWMSLHQALCSVIQVLHLLADGSQIALQAFVLALQALHRCKIMSKVVRVQIVLLLINPVLGFIGIPEFKSTQHLMYFFQLTRGCIIAVNMSGLTNP